MPTIEETHAENFNRIRKHSLKEGDILIYKKDGSRHKIISIHPLYGWTVTEKCILKQNLDNIDEFSKI